MSVFAIIMGVVAVIVGLFRFMESDGSKMVENIEKGFHSEVKKDPVKARNRWAGQMVLFILLLIGIVAFLIFINF